VNVLIRILSALSLVGTLTVNALANILPLGGNQTGEVAWKYDNLFVPAGFTFSIWGVIYLLLIIFCVRFFFAKTDTVRRLGPWFIASNLLNMGWMFAWHHLLIGLSLVLMLALLASLIGFYLATRSVTSDQPGSERLGKRLPASVYLGWITVATIANASAFLTSVGWNGFGLSPEIWYGVVIGAAVLITWAVLVTRRDLAFALVPAWASWGLYSRHHLPGDEMVFAGFAPALAMGLIGAGMLVTLVRVFRRLRA
jgi:hypothetical protein